ncbi:DUF2231 domain-containing protein [Paractinoplanes durhamensis]|uniref:ABC transporter permease n=1 Tax=Paractinoplanes durhamensis TaxID=113563 RepID=A0ABQ3ZCM1_9ACTN|nr:DUF2231 domain-containing protein [Actinoplanes durhamensis]GIE07563.1 hypothetical protein Adu01nite_89130 [Actinoplanes durhamensis]
MSTVNGLPAHILLVHAIVVLLPLAALLLVLTSVLPGVRQRLAGPNAILAVVVVVLVPLTTSAGEWLEHRLPESALLRDHTELGDTAIFYAVPIAVLALVVWWRGREATVEAAAGDVLPGSGGTATLTRRRTYLAPLSTTVTAVIAVLAIISAGAGVYGVYRIGDSGSKAAWTGTASQAP